MRFYRDVKFRHGSSTGNPVSFQPKKNPVKTPNHTVGLLIRYRNMEMNLTENDLYSLAEKLLMV